MPKPGDVYNPITDSFGPPPLAPSHTPEGIAQRQQAKSIADLNQMIETRNRVPLKNCVNNWRGFGCRFGYLRIYYLPIRAIIKITLNY